MTDDEDRYPLGMDLSLPRHPDNDPYWDFTGPQRRDKALNTLAGFVRGIAADGVIVDSEIDAFRQWASENQDIVDRDFRRLCDLTEHLILHAQVRRGEIIDEILEAVELQTGGSRFFDFITQQIQKLHAVLGGIGADGRIVETELRELQRWMQQLRGNGIDHRYPFSEIWAHLDRVLADGRITPDEEEQFLRICGHFLRSDVHRTVASDEQSSPIVMLAENPDIVIADRRFCFTGSSNRGSRKQIVEHLRIAGGVYIENPSGRLDYLVFGDAGNGAWAYACYGRKAEMVYKLRNEGASIVLVRENDFFDALADAGHEWRG